VEQAPDDAPDMNAPKNETCNKTNLIVLCYPDQKQFTLLLHAVFSECYSFQLIGSYL
jgi:hypothetical protein